MGHALRTLGVRSAAEPQPEVRDEPVISDGSSVPGRGLSSLAGLALSIAHCPEVEAARREPGHPCRKIVTSQSADPKLWQAPEPWAGNLASGRIVFLSSNPSINHAEERQVRWVIGLGRSQPSPIIPAKASSVMIGMP